MSLLTVAATQMACGADPMKNLDTAEALVRAAAGKGAQLVLLQELFETPYFCADEDEDYFRFAWEAPANPAIKRFQSVARELGVVLPDSFFERAGTSNFNTVAVIDADGAVLGIYRKSHIPQAPGYQEKFYFTPGDTGFQVHETAAGRIGVGVCWDQWFPEAARLMALQGAELLLYPTAIGNEPSSPEHDSCPHWQRVMQGHAAANVMPLLASNRIGRESNRSCVMEFYGNSFIADPLGAIVTAADRTTPGIITAGFDLAACRVRRASWGVFRDRRPDLYRGLATHSGRI
jgi:N-carbamoylputrescine amidase